MLGVHEFGVFSVFYIILQYLNSIQLALIVSPMMTLAPQITGKSERAVFLKGMGGYQYLVFSSLLRIHCPVSGRRKISSRSRQD